MRNAVHLGRGCRFLLAASAVALATALPRWVAASEPVRIGGLQLMLGGEASGTYSTRSDDHFNEGEYQRSLLRLLRLTLTGELRAGPLGLVAEARSENGDVPRMYALFLRARPWRERAFDVQAGMLPVLFGSFSKGYGADPALVGYPLAYHYPTLVRVDAAPRGVEDLESRRGTGWWIQYPTGSRGYDRGLPLVSVFHPDTGVQARLLTQAWQVSVGVTRGTLGNPVLQDDNGSKQVAGRVAWRSPWGLVAGVSGARGGYAARDLVRAIPAAGDREFLQRAVGTDLEYARRHWVFRGEAVWSSWDAVAERPPLLGARLEATGLSFEGRYRPWPGVTVAARLDHLEFGDIPGPQLRSERWDASVWRAQAGVGYALRRNLGLKLAYQLNRRDVDHGDLLAVQGVVWF
jgi:hypothetical protein